MAFYTVSHVSSLLKCFLQVISRFCSYVPTCTFYCQVVRHISSGNYETEINP